MFKLIWKELEHHVPFTFVGALLGLVGMFFFYKLPSDVSYNIFYILHPIHVLLSALVTASMYSFYKCGSFHGRCNAWSLLIIGYVGAIGIATLSDSFIPFLLERLFALPHAEIHLGFIEEWKSVNSMALIGIAIAYFRPATKFPHFGHVLLSTGASLFHIIMALNGVITWGLAVGIVFFLFVAVWVPCCVSDIVFPLLFVGGKKKQ